MVDGRLGQKLRITLLEAGQEIIVIGLVCARTSLVDGALMQTFSVLRMRSLCLLDLVLSIWRHLIATVGQQWVHRLRDCF